MNLTIEIDKLLTDSDPSGHCDECIAELLAVPNLNQVEVRTSALAATAYFIRTDGECVQCGARKLITMPTGPKGQKRPADVIGDAVKVMRIATGEKEEELQRGDGKDPAAKALGAKGGKKRAENMTPERRAEIARKAAEKRWSKG